MIKRIKNNHQQGAAMLIVLLITAIASVVAISISERLALDLARTETMLLGVRGNELSSGLEALAGRLLEEDNNQEAGYDHANSLWAQPLPGLPVPGGLVTGSMQSLDGRFNLNSLLDTSGVLNLQAHEQCRRLLRALNLPQNIADALVDWQDQNGVQEPEGAEDQFYQQLDSPYLTANQPFAHITELRLVAGVNTEIYQRLVPHVSVLPVNNELPVENDPARKININLASISVLQSLHDSIDLQLATTLNQQGSARFTGVEEFFNHPALQNLNSEQFRQQIGLMIKVDSQFFLAQADVLLADRPQRYYALLERLGNQYDVHYRSFATP